MPEPIAADSEGGLPFSKGLMAQALSASGLAPERAYQLARSIEARLAERAGERFDEAGLAALAEQVLRDEEGEEAVRRYRDWQRIGRLDRPLVVLIAGTTGVGKSTLATMLANRLGVTRVIATDAIRQVLRAFFSHDFMPSVHYSAFEAGRAVEPGEGEAGDRDLVGYTRQARAVGTGVEAIVERACREGTPVVVEGVHVVPGSIDPELRARCVAVEAVVVVEDEELHRQHFHMRGPNRPAERYLESFGRIRKLQDHLVERAREESVAVVDNTSVDGALSELMRLVLDAAGRALSGDAR
jgi:2-phosphoglycerate kinase